VFKLLIRLVIITMTSFSKQPAMASNTVPTAKAKVTLLAVETPANGLTHQVVRTAMSATTHRGDTRRLVRRYVRQLALFKRPVVAGGVESVASLAEKTFAATSFWQSLQYAWEGLTFALAQERNLRIDFYLTAGAISLGALVGLNVQEWATLIQMLGFILFAELANTVVEWLVDLLTNGQFDLRAKRIKDIAAAACLVD
jgi:undecaprenol kinase